MSSVIECGLLMIWLLAVVISYNGLAINNFLLEAIENEA